MEKNNIHVRNIQQYYSCKKDAIKKIHLFEIRYIFNGIIDDWEDKKKVYTLD